MKGLLLKDFYMVLKYCRALVLIVTVFAVCSIFGDNNAFFLSYAVIITGMSAQTLISYEEYSHWDTYSLVFPYSRKQLVSSKYIVTIILISAALVITAAARFVKPYITGTSSAESVGESIIFTLAAGMICPSVTLPIIFKFGTKKGRIVYLIVTGAVFAFSGVAAATYTPKPIGRGASIILLAVCTALFAASWLLSIKIYEKREF